jgi:hypothetical protein
MASSAPNRSLVGRAAAILTTGEVAGAALDLNLTHASTVSVDFSFTIGSLTNVIVKAYASTDGTTYDPVTDHSGAAWSRTETASVERCYSIPAMPGWKFFRLTLTGTGTVTSSTAAYTYRYLRFGSQ